MKSLPSLVAAGMLAILFAPLANADDASQYAGHWWSHTEGLVIRADGTATETMRDGTTVNFRFPDIATVNGVAGGAGFVTSGHHAGAQAGFQVVPGSGGDAIALTWTDGDNGWVFCRDNASPQGRQFCGA